MDSESTQPPRIPIPQLRQLWLRTQDVRKSGASASNQGSSLEPILMHALGLNLLETYRYLYNNQGSFEDFESWILERSGTALTPARIVEINAALAGSETPSTHALEQVFSDADMHQWEEHGYVALHDAVTPEQCRAATGVLCQHLNVDLENPESWYPTQLRATIMVELIHHPALDANRRSSRIRQAFAQIWGTDDLISTNDRCGFNPPERPGFAFPGPNLHWDTSLAPPLPLGTQGILYLTDTEAEQGAFTCVPGFHRRLESWLKSLPEGANPRQQNLSAEAIPIAGKAGDLVIWHIGLPHGSRPNRTRRPRLVQYVNMYPPNRVDDRPWI